MMLRLTILMLASLLLSCGGATSEVADQPTHPFKKVVDKAEELSTIKTENIAVDTASNQLPSPLPPDLIYSWLEESPESTSTIANRIPAPDGFRRESIKKGSFAEWLRHLPLHEAGRAVYLHNGELKGNQSAHFAVVNIDPGKRDLQQCADAVMRLKAEYHFGRKEFDQIHFNYTSGDRVAFDDWARGRKPIVQGNRIQFSEPGNQTNYSYANFRKYLVQIFSYAGTASLSKELKSVAPSEVQIGDVFIRGGFPGHAVIVVDQVQNDQGEQRFLLAQSYMPAQEIHVLHNPATPASPWYTPDFGSTLNTPEWSFGADELKRFSNN